jgi:putative intracellular protease/amidase
MAYAVTSATVMTLADGSDHPTGYFAEEVIKPYRAFVAAGFEVDVITPDGNPPTADPYGLSWFFHYPEDDKDYLNSVVRTFHRDVDDIRFTLHHNTELGLAAARRIAERFTAAGLSEGRAHALASAAAKIAWQQDRQLVDVLVAEGLPAGVTRADLEQATAQLQQASAELSAAREADIRQRPSFQEPRTLTDLTDEEMARYDAMFVPGGHGPMVDMHDNPDIGRLLGILHARRAPIASLCHGPAMLLSAGERYDGQWLFDGYRLTCFTDEEEDQTEAGRLGMAWYCDTALKNAGAVFDDGPSAWNSHVVIDRNLITGQNPSSSEAIADAVIKYLRTRSAVAA